MSTPLLIGATVRKQIARLRALAEAQPVDVTGLADRLERPLGKAIHQAQMTQQSIAIPLAFLVTFSIESGHPCGTCRHMSMSVQREGRVPNPQAIWLIAQELGFWGDLEKCTVWPEQLQGHGFAVNVVQPIEPEK